MAAKKNAPRKASKAKTGKDPNVGIVQVETVLEEQSDDDPRSTVLEEESDDDLPDLDENTGGNKELDDIIEAEAAVVAAAKDAAASAAAVAAAPKFGDARDLTKGTDCAGKLLFLFDALCTPTDSQDSYNLFLLCTKPQTFTVAHHMHIILQILVA